MKELFAMFERIFISGNISETILILILVAIILIGTIIGLIKLVKTGKAVFGGEVQDRVTRHDLRAVKIDIKDDTDNLSVQLKDIESKIINLENKCNSLLSKEDDVIRDIEKFQNILNDLKNIRTEDSKILVPIGNDLTRLSAETQNRYNELSHQIQAVQKDLASLQGTVIGIGTNRSRIR